MLPPNIRRASSTGVAAKGCTALSNTIKASTVTAKEIISMGWKVFGVTLKEDWPQKVVSERNGCPFIWLNMSGVTIIEMIVFKSRKYSL